MGRKYSRDVGGQRHRGRQTQRYRERHRDAKRDTQREIRETETETYPERMNPTPEREWGLFIAIKRSCLSLSHGLFVSNLIMLFCNKVFSAWLYPSTGCFYQGIRKVTSSFLCLLL